MNRYLLAVAVMSLFLGACGKSEEPKMEESGAEEKAMQSSTGDAMESASTGAETEGAAPAMEGSGAKEMMDEASDAVEATVEEASDTMEATMAEAAAQAEEVVEEVTSAPAEETTVAQASSGAGKQAYDQICFACHDQGISGAPKLGDQGAWAPRIAKGNETLYNNAINGFQGEAGVMPAKGGMTSLSDDQVKAAVDYMVEQSK